MIERREPFVIDAAKFSTQREVTYALILIFGGVVFMVLYRNDQSERSMIIQAVITLATLAVGYWLGASKAAADSGQAMSRIAEASAPAAALAVAAATGVQSPSAQTGTIQADTVNVESSVTNVSGDKKP